ncbi:MAG: hypothetical protein U0793_32305 [Gemmataceae bacterium]
MSGEAGPREPTAQDTAALLKRILETVEGDKRGRWTEMACAVLLALSTMASAWCAYQATLWGGVQTFRLAAVARTGREATRLHVEALQLRAFDAQMLIALLETKGRGDEKTAAFLQERFRPEAKRAVDAWLATDPFTNPKAPKAPFQMAQYVQSELLEATRCEQESATHQAAAEHANENSDTYVLLTVLFATVLFFGGIGATLDSRRLRYAVFGIAIMLFLGTMGFLWTMPLCRE